MLYKEPFVLYLNLSVCAILLFLALPSLLNRREDVKIRLAFSLIFFTAIINCTTNVLILLLGNYHLVSLAFLLFFIPLLFGPAVYYYVKRLLGSTVNKSIFLTLVPGVISFSYGLYLAFSDSSIKQEDLRQIIAGEHGFFNLTNFTTLLFILIYCVKSWVFLRKLKLDTRDKFYVQTRLKKAWAREFIFYIFAPVLVFSILHILALSGTVPLSVIDMDLIWMPVFMLFVYLMLSIRSMTMYKEFEHQLVMARFESEKQAQAQRLEIARDLHDSLGAQLTFIASASDGLKRNVANLDEELKNRTDTLTDFTDNAIAELKNALWVLSSDEIRLESLKNKLLNFIKAAGEAREGIQYNLSFKIQENLRVDSKWAVNLFRIVQELVNNTAKYSQASNVWIEAEQVENALCLSIRDNGIGFDLYTSEGASYDVGNLKQRVESMDGTFSIRSEKGNGTICSLKMHLR